MSALLKDGFMYDLNSARENISKIDRQMAKLFEERMRQAETVAAYKKENGFPIFDGERESFLINRNSAFVSEDIKPYYKEFLTDLMDVSKKYQQKLISGMTVAFSIFICSSRSPSPSFFESPDGL